MPTGFDTVAKFYDPLARLVFGKTIVNARLHFLPSAAKQLHTDTPRVLILGGGTGKALTEVFKYLPKSEVVYLDASAEMISLSEKRLQTEYPGKIKNVRFLTATEKDIPAESFDLIISNFFLDLFEKEKLMKLIPFLRERLTEKGIWLVTDFRIEKKSAFWQKPLVRVMYTFFLITCGLKTQRLQNFKQLLSENEMQNETEAFFFSRMISTGLWRKIRKAS